MTGAWCDAGQPWARWQTEQRSVVALLETLAGDFGENVGGTDAELGGQGVLVYLSVLHDDHEVLVRLSYKFDVVNGVAVDH